MMMKNAVVIGLGIGMAHVAAYMKSSDVRLHGVCDVNPIRTARIGGTFEEQSMLCLKPLFPSGMRGKSWQEAGVKVYPSIEAVMDDPQVDLVSICTPDYLHPAHLELAMVAQKDILLEKPIAIDLMQAEKLNTKMNSYPRAFSIDYEFRLNPAIEKLKELLDVGELGAVEGLSLYHFRTPFRRDKWHKWIQKKEYCGGLIIEETCHWFDLVCYLSGKQIASVYCLTASGVHADFDYEDIAYINGSFHDGGIVQISHALTGFDFSLQIHVHGQRGTAWCALKEDRYSSLDGGSSEYLGIVSCARLNQSPRDAQIWQWGQEATEPWNIHDFVLDFAHRAVHHIPQRVCWNDGYTSLKLAVKALESAQTGSIVTL